MNPLVPKFRSTLALGSWKTVPDCGSDKLGYHGIHPDWEAEATLGFGYEVFPRSSSVNAGMFRGDTMRF